MSAASAHDPRGLLDRQPHRRAATDPVRVLDELADEARRAIVALREGRAVTGRNALGKIEQRARDGARHVREDRAAGAAAAPELLDAMRSAA